jgi:hypothetical protein
VNDVLVVALVLLLVASGYAAGRVHAEMGYRTGFRSGYRQGHADGVRHRPPPWDTRELELRVSGVEPRASEVRQYDVVGGRAANATRHTGA